MADNVSRWSRGIAVGALVLACVLGSAGWASPGLAPGNLRGFGYNLSGQLGDNSNTDRSAPVSVSLVGVPLSSIVQVACGQNHTVALDASGNVWAWGQDNLGQLGDAGTTDKWEPVLVHEVGDLGFLSNVVAVSAGADFSVAVKRDGTVVAWGAGTLGQLGVNGTSDSGLPVVVHGVGDAGTLSNVVSVACGYGHTLALRADGSVVSWGYNGTGGLGDGSTSDRGFPEVVAGLGTVTAVAAGSGHSLALKSNHTVLAWGSGTTGQLGNGASSDSGTPVVVSAVGGGSSLASVAAIACGGTHSLALLTDGTMVSWGGNYNGQLGNNDGGFGSDRNTPQVVQAVGGGSSLSSVKGIAAGNSHSVALLRNGTAVAWGFNDYGQLGDNDAGTDKWAPVHVLATGGAPGSSLANVSQLAAGALGDYSMALVSTYQAVDHAVGNDGLSRILYWAPGANSNVIRIDSLAATGQSKSTVAAFNPPAGTPIPTDMILAGTNLAVLFVDSLTSPTMVSIAVVPEAGGSVVKSLATPRANKPLNLGYRVGTLYLFSGAGTIGGDAEVATVDTLVDGVALSFTPLPLFNPATDPANGDMAVKGAFAASGNAVVLYNTFASSSVSGWVLGVYPGPVASGTSLPIPGAGAIDFYMAPGDMATVLTTTGTGGQTTWAVSTLPLPPTLGFPTSTSSPTQNSGGSLGQLQPISLAMDTLAPGEPRLLMANDLTWLRKHLGLGTVTESRPGSGRIWQLNPITNNPSWASLAFRD